MSERQKLSARAQLLYDGVRLAHQRMLREKALRGQNVVISDDNGVIKEVPAKDILEQYEEYR